MRGWSKASCSARVGCDEKETDGGDPIGDERETTTDDGSDSSSEDGSDSSSEDGSDSSSDDGSDSSTCGGSGVGPGGNGTSDYCAMLTEQECLDSSLDGGPCFRVLGRAVEIDRGFWCPASSSDYLGCIDVEDAG